MYAVKGFLPSGAVCIVRGELPRHRDGERYIAKRQNELLMRFGIRLFVGINPERR